MVEEEDIPDWKKRLQRMDDAVGRKKDKRRRCDKCQSLLRAKRLRDFPLDPTCYKCSSIKRYKANPSKTKNWQHNKGKREKR